MVTGTRTGAGGGEKRTSKHEGGNRSENGSGNGSGNAREMSVEGRENLGPYKEVI